MRLRAVLDAENGSEPFERVGIGAERVQLSRHEEEW
jgi:hypothetical protein